MEIATGNAESHPTTLPYDPGESPATARPTETVGQLSGPTAAAASVSYPAQVAGVEADIAAAQAAGHAAETDRRNHYAQDILPQGAAYGDAVSLPPVPSAALPPAASDEYPFSGLEPVPSAAGFAGEYIQGA